MNSPEGKWLTKAIKNEYQQEPIKIRMMGGTVPIAAFIREMKIPAIIVPMVNADNNQHSPNENFKISYLKNSMRTFYGILTTKMSDY
jgi:acetylornithine deacetylase/succinyl-diaminopimelate desuccinylase-like protein